MKIRSVSLVSIALCCLSHSLFAQCEYYSVKFRNSSSRVIHLAVNYVPLEREITSSSFESKAWYIFEPGETKQIFNTRCFTFYWYADTPPDRYGRKKYWEGNKKIYADGKYFLFNAEDCRDYNAALVGKACVIQLNLTSD